jgi:hypothetical protein
MAKADRGGSRFRPCAVDVGREHAPAARRQEIGGRAADIAPGPRYESPTLSAHGHCPQYYAAWQHGRTGKASIVSAS